MLSQAQPLGAELIDAEARLDMLFAETTPDITAIHQATASIAAIEGRLRAVHLAAHLQTAPLLSHHQRMLYIRARGYDSGQKQHGEHAHH